MAGQALLSISKDEVQRAKLESEYKYVVDLQSKIVDARREGAADENAKWAGVVAEKDAEIADKDAEIANKDAEIAGKDTALAEQATEIASKDTELAAQAAEIARLQAMLDAR